MIEMIVIGTSAGGVDMLQKLAPAFRKSGKVKAAVVIHMSPSGPNLIPSLMAENCEFKVKEAEPGEPMEADTIYIAPPDYHLCLEPNNTISLSTEEAVNFSRPSIDVLFDSAAYSFGEKAVGILLTGSNNDGAEGLKKIKSQGGIAVVQKPSDAEWGVMPASAIEIMKPDYILTTEEIIKFISEISLEGTLYERK